MLRHLHIFSKSTRKFPLACTKTPYRTQFVRRAHDRSCIGIDWGTATSVVTVLDEKDPRVVENIEGERTTPTYVANTDEGFLVGITARKQAVRNPENTFFGIRAILGTKYDKEILDRLAMPYKITPGAGTSISIQDGGGQIHTLESVCSHVISRMKETAENTLGEKVESAVVGIPPSYDDAQKEALSKSMTASGLKVAALVSEPIAAAMAYGFGREPVNKNLLVYDLGGRCFDLSLLKVSGSTIEVTEHIHTDEVGGHHFDKLFVDYLADDFQQKENIDLRQNIAAIQKLVNAAEVSKCELSTSNVNEINLPFIAGDASGPKHLVNKVSRTKLESITLPLINKSIDMMKALLEKKSLSTRDIDELLLVGGQAKMPRVSEELEAFFGKPVFKTPSISPDEVVALGLLLCGAEASQQKVEALVYDNTPFDIGIETRGGVMSVLVPRNTSLPCNVTAFLTTTTDNQTDIDIRLFQGNSSISSKNLQLAKMALQALPRSLKGEPKIEISIDINKDGLISIIAKDYFAPPEQEPIKIGVQNMGNLSPDQITELQKPQQPPTTSVIGNEFYEELYTLERALHGYRKILNDDDRADFLKAVEDLRLEAEKGSPEATSAKIETIRVDLAKKVVETTRENNKKRFK